MQQTKVGFSLSGTSWLLSFLTKRLSSSNPDIPQTRLVWVGKEMLQAFAYVRLSATCVGMGGEKAKCRAYDSLFFLLHPPIYGFSLIFAGNII